MLCDQVAYRVDRHTTNTASLRATILCVAAIVSHIALAYGIIGIVLASSGGTSVSASLVAFVLLGTLGVIFSLWIAVVPQQNTRLVRILEYRAAAATALPRAIVQDEPAKAALLDQIALIHEFDETGRITAANELFCGRTGFRFEELVTGGHKLLMAGLEDGKTWLQHHARDPRYDGWSGKLLITTKDGVDLHLSSAIVPIRNDHGQTIGYASASIDITENEQLREEFERNGKLMQLGQLTATVAHEIRNPLGAIRTANFVLEKKLKGNIEGIEPQLDRIKNGILRCDKIITDLLDFSRRKSTVTQSVDVDRWLQGVIDEEGKTLVARPAIEMNLGLAGMQAILDPDQLRQVLNNLLSNASEALAEKARERAEDGFQPRIVISSEIVGSDIQIRVSDNGPGITQQNLQKIREPLFTTKSFGVGLGLPTVIRILEKHGGGLDIQSQFGEGTTMCVRLPQPKNIASAA